MAQSVRSSSFEEGAAATEPGRERHPWGLYVLFATEMWERFGFYTAAAIMTLYLQRGGFGWTRDQATTLWSNYLMFVYATPLIGGWLADRFLGYRRSVLIGGLFFIAGYALLGLGSVGDLLPGPGADLRRQRVLQAEHLDDGRQSLSRRQPAQGLGLQHLLHGHQHRRPRWRRSSAEVLLQLSAGGEVLEAAKSGKTLTADQAASLRSGFLAAFYRGRGRDDARHGHLRGALPQAGRPSSAGMRRRTTRRSSSPSPRTSRPSSRSPPSTRCRNGTGSPRCWSSTAIVIVFWMVFHQNGSTMTYWADENTDWNVSGVISNSINPFWIVVLSLPLVRFWGWLNKRGLEPSTPTKMVIGMFLTSLAFLILFVAAKSGGDQTFLTDSAGNFLRDDKGVYKMEQHRVSPLWLITAYMVISLGELMLSPMGLSLVSKVAPVRMRGLMMGGWFVATAIGNKLTAIGLLWTQWYHSSFWLLCSLSALVMAIVLLFLLKPLKRAMPGV